MAKSSVITLPNGTTIEVSPDLTPDQITAMITALTANPGAPVPMAENPTEGGEVYLSERTLDDIWNSSKKERVALFLRNFVSDNFWFQATDIMDQQLQEFSKIVLGETSAIGTYLARLFEGAYLDKRKTPNGRTVHYRITAKLQEEYPLVTTHEIKQLVIQKI